jgi:hypothetical protein
MDHGVYGPHSFISCKGKRRGRGINACVSFLNQTIIIDPGILRRDPVHALLAKAERGRGIIIHVYHFVNSNPRYPKYRWTLDLHHVSFTDGWSRSISGLSPWSVPIPCHQDSRNPEFQILDTDSSLGTFTLVHKGLTLIPLFTDPTVVEVFLAKI